MKPNDPTPVNIGGVECHVYEAGPYAAVDADIESERKDGRSVGAVAREMALWAGIRGAENLKWMLNEMLAQRNRDSFHHGQTRRALKSLLYALHARPMAGHELPSVEDAIATANELLDKRLRGD